MISISSQPLLDLGRSLAIKPGYWKKHREKLHEISTRGVSAQVNDPAMVAEKAAALVETYGDALREASLTFGEASVPLNDSKRLNDFLKKPDLAQVEIILTLKIDKNRLIADWLRQEKQVVPTAIHPRLVFFRETLEALFQDTLAALAGWWEPQSPGKVALLCSEWEWSIDGPYLAVTGGDGPAAWQRVMSGRLPGRKSNDPDAPLPQEVHEARNRNLNWPSGSLPALTPLHLEGESDAPADDVVANAWRVHTIDLCILYTANRIELKQKDDWSQWTSAYVGSDAEAKVAAGPPEQAVGEGARAAAALTELMIWCYGKGFPGAKLSFLQSILARSLKDLDPQVAFKALVQEAEKIWQQIEPSWRMFVDGKLDEFGDQVRALEDYVTATVQSFSDQISGLIKSLSETMLAAVAVLLGAFIATLISKESTPEILKVAVSIYLVYLVVFPLTYNMWERRQSYRALVRQFEQRRERFNVNLSKAQVDNIIGDHVSRNQQRFRRWFWLIAATYLAVAIVLWWLVPSPVDSVAYEPEPAPELIPNRGLQNSRPIVPGRLAGAEDVAVDAAGRLYTGTADGKVMRINMADGSERLEVFAETGGRPLGLRIREGTAATPDAAAVPWTLFVADARKGLLAIDAGGGVTPLVSAAGGVPFGFTNDLDVAADDRIYFSDASSRFGVDRYLYDLLESRPHGRLLVHDPATRETKVLLDGLFFANGVALSREEDFVLVAETYRYSIRRYWLKGGNAGASGVLLENLPGFPDNLSRDRQTGHFWVAFFTVRNATMDKLHPHPFRKEQLAKLPGFLWPKPKPYGLVIELDERGKILRTLQDPEGWKVRGVTSVEPHQGNLYLGSLDEGITRVPLAEGIRREARRGPVPRP